MREELVPVGGGAVVGVGGEGVESVGILVEELGDDFAGGGVAGYGCAVVVLEGVLGVVCHPYGASVCIAKPIECLGIDFSLFV